MASYGLDEKRRDQIKKTSGEESSLVPSGWRGLPGSPSPHARSGLALLGNRAAEHGQSLMCQADSSTLNDVLEDLR